MRTIMTSPAYNPPKPRRRRGKRSTVVACPSIQTSTTFMANRDDGFSGDDNNRKRRVAEARAAGINPTGMVWSSQLSCFYSSKDDIRRIHEERGIACEGLVNVKAPEREVPDDGPYQVADDLVQDKVASVVHENYEGDIGEKELTELTETTRTRMTGVVD